MYVNNVQKEKVLVPCGKECQDPSNGGRGGDASQAMRLPRAHVMCTTQYGCQTHDTRDCREHDYIEGRGVVGDRYGN